MIRYPRPDHRPAPPLVDDPVDELGAFAVGVAHGGLHDRNSGAHLVQNAHQARHALAGAEGFDLFEAKESTAQRADRACYPPVRYRDEGTAWAVWPATPGR